MNSNTKVSNTSERLREIMKEKNLRQVDILEKCAPYCSKYKKKIGRNDLSQYVNGKTEPRQDKLYILALALNVNEAWLMGFDVPPERINQQYVNQKYPPHVQTFLNKTESLNTDGWKELNTYADYLLSQEKYLKIKAQEKAI